MKGSVDGIAWEDRGSPGAAPILLVRPLGGTMALWGEFATLLERDLRVLAFDARGTGDSRGPARTSTRGLAADAFSVLDERQVERAHVFGISLGGMVATRIAIDAPERVSSVVIASAPASGLAFERAGLVRAFRFARCLTHRPRQAERCIVTRVLSHEFRAEHPREAERIEELAARAPTSRVTILAHALAGVRHDASAELGAIHSPTLVLAGDRDRLLGHDAGLVLESGIRGARRLVIMGAGHDLTLERPRETASRVLRFVSSLAGEASTLHQGKR